MKKLGIIYCPRPSDSAAALAREVPLFRVGPDGFKSPAGLKMHRNITPRGRKTLNWGSTGVLDYTPINSTAAVKKATSKLKTLTILKDASIPALEATGEADVAEGWVRGGTTVLARKDGLSGGKGIFVQKGDPEAILQHWQNYDLYVKYWKKTHEYRVHVFDGEVIDIQQKRRRTEWTGNYDPMIRNFDNGWVFCHDNLKGTTEALAAIGATATQAVAALGLDFGAVDVLARFNDLGNLKKHVVCEINTAPGLEGTTLNKYVTAIRNYLTQQA